MSSAENLSRAVGELVVGGAHSGVPITAIDAMAAAIGATRRDYTEYAQSFTEYTFPDGSTITYGRDEGGAA